jgi:uncharacterized delta-60 repeat protein
MRAMHRLIPVALLPLILLAVGPSGAAGMVPGSDGFEVATDLGGSDAAYAVTFLPGGRIVVAGSTSGSSALVSYRPDGSLDPGFGDGGVVLTDFSSHSESIRDIGVQGNNRVVLAVEACSIDLRCGLLVARYLRDGSLDPGFGKDGVRFYGAPASGEALAVQRDGRLVTAGSGWNGVDSDFAVVRFEPDGRLDRSFGTDGRLLTDFGGGDRAADVKIQEDEKIVVAGSTGAGREAAFALARYLPDGSLDPSFGQGGMVTTDVGYCCATASGLAVQPDGRLVVAGNAADGDTGLWVLTGYNPDGSLDATFGEGGVVISRHGGFGTELTDAAEGVGGQVVVSGWDGDEGPWAYFLVSWYDAQGSLIDTEYGGFGGEAAEYAYGIATSSDGHAAAVGKTADIDGTTLDFAVGDYPGPSLDR